MPTGRLEALELLHVAVPGLPGVTLVVPQAIFALHATVPVIASGLPLLFLCPLTFPFSPLIVAVHVIDVAYVLGFGLQATLVVDVAH